MHTAGAWVAGFNRNVGDVEWIAPYIGVWVMGTAMALLFVNLVAGLEQWEKKQFWFGQNGWVETATIIGSYMLILMVLVTIVPKVA